MKRFLFEFFIAIGIVAAAGAGIMFLASAAFDVHVLPESDDSGIISAASANDDPLIEKISPDDPWHAAWQKEQENAIEAEQSSSAELSEDIDRDTSEDRDKLSAEQEEQNRIASYIPMDGTYSGDITGAGGDFRVTDADGDGKVIFTFAGDILFSGDYATGVQAGTIGIMNCFDEGTTELMRDADIFMVNNEFEYTTGGTPVPDKQFTLRANPGTVEWLKEMGVDIVSLANNHMFDFQEVGLQDTLDTLRGADVPYVGAGENIEEASNTAYIHVIANGTGENSGDSEDTGDVQGAESITDTESDKNEKNAAEEMTIAIVNATQVEQYANPDTRGATETESGVFRCYDPTLLYQKISEAKENADFVIVYIHWGVESTQEKEYRQDELADGITKAGGDLIVGDHPHVLQAIGAVNGKPVAYSMGNYFFTSHTTDTGLLQAVFDPASKTMTGLRFVPCLQSNLSVQLLDGSEKERVLNEMRGLSESCGVAIDEDGWISWS